MVPIPSRFTATHEITLTRRDGIRTTIPMMDVGGYGFTRDDVQRAIGPSFLRHHRRWAGHPAGPISSTVELSARRLSRGSDPRGAARLDRKIEVRVSAAQLESFDAAAAAAGFRSRSEWALDLLDRAAGNRPHGK